jgi:DNA-binding NarL/FixJ family response regulator
MKNVSLYFIDDHKLFREMLIEMFSRSEEFTIAGESGSLKDAIEQIKNYRPDVVLLDINLNEQTGFDAIPFIRKYSPGSKIIGVSMHLLPAYTQKMFRLGAHGYVTKNSSRVEFLKAINEVLKGYRFVCSEIKDIISEKDFSDSPKTSGLNVLTCREIEIIQMLKQGFSSKEIGSELSLSVRTIEVHRYNILKKMKLKNAASLINFIQSESPDFLK